MVDPIFGDNALISAKLALDGLSRRQEVIGQNVSNVDTPGYKSVKLDFESALKNAMDKAENKSGPVELEKTNPGHLAAPTSESVFGQISARKGGSERADGNNVDIDVELSEMAETGIRYQALTQLVNKKFTILRTLAR